MNVRKFFNCAGKIGLFLFLVFGLVGGYKALYADDILPQRTTTVDDNLIIKTIPSEKSERPAVYNLKRWVVEENTDPVKHALEVYKKKSKSQYVKRIWITDKKDGTRRMIVEYTPRSVDDKIIFSQDEDFMYYFGVSPGGASIVYGINLLSNKKFSLGSGENFSTVNCPDKKSYVIVQSQGQSTIYQVFTIAGKRMKTLADPKSPVDIEKSLCR